MSIAVAVDSQMVAGRTAQAVATASLRNGQTQAVTTGWKSDTPAVATVTDDGTVTAVSPGLANIYVVALGTQGLKQVRVRPNFQGRWQGNYVFRTCAATGDFQTKLETCTAGLAKQGLVGAVLPTTMNLTQNGASVSGTFLLGTRAFTPVTATIEDDDSLILSGVSTGDFIISLDVTWHVSTPQPGRIVGGSTYVERSSTTYSGEARLTTDIVGALNRTDGP